MAQAPCSTSKRTTARAITSRVSSLAMPPCLPEVEEVVDAANRVLVLITRKEKVGTVHVDPLDGAIDGRSKIVVLTRAIMGSHLVAVPWAG